MNAPEPERYQIYGTLPLGHWSYLSRLADQQVLAEVRAGNYVSVLTARQMGKSSLMVRIKQSAAEAGASCARLDFSSFGAGWTPEAFFPFLIEEIHRQLKLPQPGPELRPPEPTGRPPARQLFEYFEHLAAHATGKIIIFLDEIDYFLSAAVTPDLFAIIRACFNERAERPEFLNLSFVLFGAATPSQLIDDPDRTPFNIGTRAVLPDFTRAEIAPLGCHLHPDASVGSHFLDAIYDWTSGHPGLTQALCKATAAQLAGGPQPHSPADLVNTVVRQQFLTNAARSADENLNYIRVKLVRTPGLLQLYEQACGGGLRDEPASQSHSMLRLSGVVHVDSDGLVKVRNRLYKEVFSPAWIQNETENIEQAREPTGGRPRARTIGVVAVSLMGYATELIDGIQKALAKRNTNLIVFAGGALGTPSGGAERLYQLAKNSVDGLIIMSGTLCADAQQLTQFCDQLRPTPLLSIAMAINRVPSVLANNGQGTRLALEHLHQVHGCRRIAFITGPEANEDARTRRKAYHEYVQSSLSGATPVADEPALIWTGDFEPESARRAVRAAVEAGIVFDAVLAANDAMAAAAQNELQELGRKVPIIGFDDTDAALSASPQLTTVGQPFARLGETAVELLWRQLENEPLEFVSTLDVTGLVVRESCLCDPQRLVQDTSETDVKRILTHALERLHVDSAPAAPLAQAFALYQSGAQSRTPSKRQAAQRKFVETLSNEFAKARAVVLRPWGETGLVAWHYALRLIRGYVNRKASREVAPQDYDGRMLVDDVESQQRQQAEALWHDANAELWEVERRQRLKRDLEASHRMRVLSQLSSTILTTLDLDRVMDIIARKLCELGVRDCLICQYEEGSERVDVGVPLTDPLVRVLLRMENEQVKGHTDEVASASKLVRELGERAERSAHVIVPLRVDDYQLGFASFALHWPLEQEEYERISEQVSAVVRSAHMKALGRRYEEAFASLPKLASQLMNPRESEYLGPRLRDVLTDCAKRALEVLRADPVTVYEWDASCRKFVLNDREPAYACRTNFELRHMRTAVEDDDVPAVVVRGGRSLFYGTDDYRMAFRNVPVETYKRGRPPFALREGIKAMAALVLSAGEEIVGVMFVNYREPHEFGLQERAIHEAFATYAAIAIRHARMTRDIPKTLHDILGAILNPIRTRTRAHLAEIAVCLGSQSQPPEPGGLQKAHQLLRELQEFSAWYADAYAEPTLEELRLSDVLDILRASEPRVGAAEHRLDLQAVVVDDVEPARVRGCRAHLLDVAASLVRTALEQRATTVQIQIRRGNDLTVEIEFHDNGEVIDEAARMFDFDAKRPVPEGRGRTLWWCRTALLRSGAGLALKNRTSQAATSLDGNTFILQLPLVPPPAFE